MSPNCDYGDQLSMHESRIEAGPKIALTRTLLDVMAWRLPRAYTECTLRTSAQDISLRSNGRFRSTPPRTRPSVRAEDDQCEKLIPQELADSK